MSQLATNADAICYRNRIISIQIIKGKKAIKYVRDVKKKPIVSYNKHRIIILSDKYRLSHSDIIPERVCGRSVKWAAFIRQARRQEVTEHIFQIEL